jgi:hypothetical protein
MNQSELAEALRAAREALSEAQGIASDGRAYANESEARASFSRIAQHLETVAAALTTPSPTAGDAEPVADMTPLRAMILLHYYGCAGPYAQNDYRHANSRATLEYHAELVQRGLLRWLPEKSERGAKYECTEAGRARVHAMLTTPPLAGVGVPDGFVPVPRDSLQAVLEMANLAGDEECTHAEACINIVDEVTAMLSASPTPPADGWRDIATAPRDGSLILACRPRWIRAAIFEWNDDDDNWWSNDSEAVGAPQPTFWQPLPPPPSTAPVVAEAAPGMCWQHRPEQVCPCPQSCRSNGCSAVERELFPDTAPERDPRNEK